MFAYWLSHWKTSPSAAVPMLCRWVDPLWLCCLEFAQSSHSLQCDKDVSFSSHSQGKKATAWRNECEWLWGFVLGPGEDALEGSRLIKPTQQGWKPTDCTHNTGLYLMRTIFPHINNYGVVVCICVLQQQKEFQSLNASLQQNVMKKYLFYNHKINFKVTS